MRVKATRRGFFDNKMIREGETFVIQNEKQFSGNWMKKLEEKSSGSSKGRRGREESEPSLDTEPVSGDEVI